MIIYNGENDISDPYRKSVDEAVSCGIRHIGISTYSSGKVKIFLMNKGFSEDVAADAVRELIENRYIDDMKAAQKVLRARTDKKQESAAFIYNRLIEAGIAEDVADSICDELPPDKETCKALYRSLDLVANPEDHREDYLRLASRRGYTYETASSAFNAFLNE